MDKRIFVVFLFFALFFFSSCGCSRNSASIDENNNDADNGILPDANNELANDSDNCIKFTDFYANGAGSESCPCQNDVDRIKRSINDVTGSEKGNTMKIEEILYLEDRNEVVPKGDCGQENKCALTFKNYDRSLFKDSLIGKEWVLYLIEGFYGSVYGEYVSRDVQVIRHKDGTLIAASGTGIVNEDGEHEWDDKVWPSKLVPEIKAEQKVLSTCESFCVKFQSGEDGKPLGDWQYDHIIAPPVEITVEGKTPVIVKNGEVIRSEGYEYFVRDSIRVTEEDSDGYILSYGKKYKFDFFVVNVEALK
ncbi:MAG: hypothetical protein PHR06_15955 [Candidatus Cloacimonetes bacterium]|nr:hypothetical protein [Candidatus Cloacimonadota bacterium]